MYKNFKTFIKYIMFNHNLTFIKNNSSNNSHNIILISNNTLSYLALHYRLSSFFYMNQLVDIFAYEVPSKNYLSNKININESDSVVVYNFHSIYSQDRSFIFSKSFGLSNDLNPSSITDYFFSANWLEREASELSSINFYGKKDLRNLMLQYGETSSPLKKTFPSVGYKEVIYSSISDSVIQKDITLNL